jgi:molybdopterin-binding protein
MQISARNVLAGTVKHVEHGAVNTEVTIELAGGVQLVSIITKHSAERLKLAVGKKAHAVIKSSDVLVATDD